MQKIVIGLIVLGLCTQQVSAMQMETAHNKSSKKSSNTCANAAKTCCYLSALCGLMTQPADAQAGRLGMRARCHALNVAHVVAGLGQGGAIMVGVVSPSGLASCYAQELIASSTESEYGPGNVADYFNSLDYRYSQYTEEEKEKYLAAYKKHDAEKCDRLFQEEEREQKTLHRMNERRKFALNYESVEAQEIRHMIEKNDEKRAGCRERGNDNRRVPLF